MTDRTDTDFCGQEMKKFHRRYVECFRFHGKYVEKEVTTYTVTLNYPYSIFSDSLQDTCFVNFTHNCPY